MPDKVSQWYLSTVAVLGIVYVCCAWTPSCYGLGLNQIQASPAGQVAADRDLALVAFGTSQGEVRLIGGGCQ